VYGTVETPPASDGTSDEFATADPPTSEEPLLPTEAWTSAAAHQWRGWLLLGVAGVLGVGLAILLFSWIISRNSSTSSSSVATEQGPDPDPSPPKPEADPEGEPATPPGDAPEPGESNPPPESDGQETPSPDEIPESEPDPGPKPEITPPTVPDAAEKTEDAGGESGEAPPGFVEPSDSEAADSMSPLQSLRDTLASFGAMLDEPGAADTPAAKGALVVPGVAAGGGGLARPAPRAVDVKQRLSDRFKRIEFDETPLADFLDFITDYSTIPITLDPDVLPWLELSPTTPVNVSLGDVTVATALESALKPLKLSYQATDGQLLVTRLVPAETPLRDASLDVSDLTGGAADRSQRLTTRIEQMIVPDSWTATGGPGTVLAQEGVLQFSQREDVLYQVLALCEKLRIARGLPTQSKFPASFFPLASRLEQARPSLDKRVTLNFLRPTPFVRVVKRLSQEAGVHLLVDWRAAGGIGWNPDAMVTFTVVDQPLGDALHRLLEPMDLAIRIVRADLVQITTQHALNARIEVEFYAAADLLEDGTSADQLMQRVRTHLGAAAFRDSGGVGVLHFDPQSQQLIAAFPQPQQISLAELLAGMR